MRSTWKQLREASQDASDCARTAGNALRAAEVCLDQPGPRCAVCGQPWSEHRLFVSNAGISNEGAARVVISYLPANRSVTCQQRVLKAQLESEGP